MSEIVKTRQLNGKWRHCRRVSTVVVCHLLAHRHIAFNVMTHKRTTFPTTHTPVERHLECGQDCRLYHQLILLIVCEF